MYCGKSSVLVVTTSIFKVISRLQIVEGRGLRNVKNYTQTPVDVKKMPATDRIGDFQVLGVLW